MGTNGRENIEESDKVWNNEYDVISNCYVPKKTLLYRVHTWGYEEPKKEDYDDRGEYQTEVFNREHQFWENQNDLTKIRWDGHWVSFTKNVDIIGSNYFSGKNLRGFVIVIESQEAIDIGMFKKSGFNEYEVVAPMNKDTCIDVLNFDEFIIKYGTGSSDYETKIWVYRWNI